MSDEMPEQAPAEDAAPQGRDEIAASDVQASEAHADEAGDAQETGEPTADAEAEAPAEAGEATAPDAEAARAAGADTGRPAMERAQLEAIVEALLFASPEPLTPKMLFKLLSDEPKEDIQAALDALSQKYEGGGGLHLAQVAGGFQITTRPELHDWVRRLFHERSSQKLSVAALETLSVIAYRQPVTAAEVNEIRAVNASGVLSTLLERHLIKIVGRKNVVGRPFLYGTTKEFLLRFGLKDLTDLPKIEDMVQALGFDPPPMLLQKPPSDELLPLEGDDLATAGGGEE